MRNGAPNSRIRALSSVTTETRSWEVGVEFAGIVVAVLLVVVAGFQLALALGARWGEHAYGGRADITDGRLSAGYRVMSAVAVPILLAAAGTVLAAADVVSGGSWGNVAVWFVFGYLVLNTAANLASSSKVERYGMGSITAVAAVATLVVAVG